MEISAAHKGAVTQSGDAQESAQKNSRAGSSSQTLEADLKKLTTAQLNKLSPAQLKKLSTTQLNKLNTSQLNKLAANQLNKLSSSKLKLLSVEAQAKLSDASKVRAGLESKPKAVDKVSISAEGQAALHAEKRLVSQQNSVTATAVVTESSAVSKTEK
jgi:hypothetical protein